MGLFKKLSRGSDLFRKASEQGRGLFNKASDAISLGTEFVSSVGDKVSDVANTVEKNVDKVSKFNDKYINPALQGAALAGIPGASQLLGASDGLSTLAGRIKDTSGQIRETNSKIQNVNNKVAKGNQVANRVARKI